MTEDLAGIVLVIVLFGAVIVLNIVYFGALVALGRAVWRGFRRKG